MHVCMSKPHLAHGMGSVGSLVSQSKPLICVEPYQLSLLHSTRIMQHQNQLVK
jgi:hypothetical protein